MVVLLIMGMLFASFRNWQGVILPLLNVVISTIWSVGLMGFFKVPFTQLGSILPVVFASVGSAYGIHVLHRYREESVSASAATQAVHRTVTAVGPAVFMAGATTMAGFLSNAFTSVIRIREFGYFATFGVVAALLVALLGIPAVLCVLGPRAKQKPHKIDEIKRHGILSRIGAYVVRKQGVVAVVTAVVLLAAVASLPRLTTDTSFINFFDKNTSTRKAFDVVQEHFGGMEALQMVVTGDIVSPEVLRGMEKVQQQLGGISHLASPISLVDLVKRVSRELHAGDPAFARIPDTREEISQYLLLLSLSGDATLSQFVTVDYAQTKMEAFLGEVTSAERAAVLAQVEAAAAELGRVPGVERVEITGLPLLSQAMADLITLSQIQSLVISIVVVFLLVWFLVGSVGSSLMCLVPIVITIIVNFGIMGWTGIPFNVVTALVTSIAVGMGIDYSIHIYNRCRMELQHAASLSEAVRSAVSTTGYAVMLNAGSVALGFIVLVLSAFQPLRAFGALVAVTMVVSGVSSVTVLPALITRGGRRSSAAGAHSQGGSNL